MTCRAVVDANACSGHGDCVEAAPSNFILEDEIAEVVADGSEELLIRAAESCPAAAISVFDLASGGQIYP